MRAEDAMNNNKEDAVTEKPVGYRDTAIVLYQTPDGSMSFDVRLERETVWMDAHQMARLFGRDRSVIVRHVRRIYETNELDEASTCAKMHRLPRTESCGRWIYSTST
jgi:hypothetical protein